MNHIDKELIFDNKIIFNKSRRSNISFTVYQLLNNNIDNYELYVKIIKKIIEDFNDMKDINVKDYLTNDDLINKQIEYVINNLPILELTKNKVYGFSLYLC